MKQLDKCPKCGARVVHSVGRVHCKGFPIRCVFNEMFKEEETDFHEMVYLILDVETTGRSPKTEYVTELGATLMKGEELIESYSSLVKPKKPIPQNIVQKINITNEMVYDARDFDEVFVEFEFWLEEKLEEQGVPYVEYVFAHNASFDYNFITAELKRNHLSYDWPFVVDTLRMARRLVPKDEVENHRQETLAEHFGVKYEGEGAHRASSDTEALSKILAQLVPRMPENVTFDDYGITAQKRKGKVL